MFDRLTSKRRVVQILIAILLTCNITAYMAEWRFYGNVCLPVLHCNACPLTWFNCPIYKISEWAQYREVPWGTLAPWMLLGIFGSIGVLVGRFFCGWVCPMGLLQDLLHSIPSPKLKVPSVLRWMKYAFLFISVGAVAYWAGKDVLYFFCKFCPVATMEVGIPQMIVDNDWALDPWRIVRLSVLVFVLVLVVCNIRSFCRIMCPVGALVAVANKFSLFSIRLDPDKCIHCGKCDKSCPMGIPVENASRTRRAINRHSECIECLNCEEACPVNAIDNNSRILRKKPAVK